MKELWRRIEHSNYEVSNLGNVRHRNTQYINTQRLTKDGYRRINISINGKESTQTVHRLVAKAFVPNPHNYNCINHKDECKTNNCAENLEWCTVGYNNTYGTSRIRGSESKSKKIVQFTQNGEMIAEYKSAVIAAQETGLGITSIGKCARGKQRTGYGYVWQYA